MKQNDETKYRWYMVNKDGIVTLCADQSDAEEEAKDAQEVWPQMGPHRAVQLVEASQAFTAADMATAAAQGFRDGQAAELAAMRAGEPVAWLVTGPYIKQPMAMRCSAEAYMRGLLKSDPDGGYEISPLYTHPRPAAQDAERKQLSKEQRAEIMEEVDSYNFPEDLIDATEKAHGIAAQQGEKHE